MNNIDSKKLEIINKYINDNFKENNYFQNISKLIDYLIVKKIKLNNDEMVSLINTNTLFENSLNEIILSNEINKLSDKNFVKSCLKSIRFLEVLRSNESTNDMNEYEFVEDISEENQSNTTLYDDILKQYVRSLPSKILTYSETCELCKRYEDNDKSALNELIYYNLRLVVSIAKKYQNKGIELIDLIQSGNEGLIKAAKKYNYKMGIKFSTYATYWIKQFIIRSIDNESRTIRVPIEISQIIFKIKKFMNDFYFEYGYNPSIEQIALQTKLPAQTIKVALKNMDSVLSYNVGISYGEYDDEIEMLEILPDERQMHFTESIDNEIFNEQFRSALDEITSISDRDKLILAYRYGFKDGKCYTLIQIGKMLGINKERVRQLEERALKKLSHNRVFKEYRKVR